MKRIAPPDIRLLFGLLIGTTLGLKLALAWRFEGFLTGDDLEIVETAARYALGLDYQPSGGRCLFHPLLFVFPAVKLGSLAGGADPAWICWLAALPTILFSTLSVFLVARLARAWGWSEPAALAAAFLSALHWLSFGYGSTQYPRPVSTALVLAAFLLASRSAPRRPLEVLAGLLAAAAFAVRWSEGVALLPLAGWTAWKRRDARSIARILSGFLLGALLFVGLVDWLTWGAPIASLAEYARALHPEPFSGYPATDTSWHEYPKTILRWAGPLYLLLLWPARRDRRIRTPLAILLTLVLLLSCFRYREWRYLQSSISFLSLAAALGWEALRRGSPVARRAAAAALLLAVSLGLERTIALLRDKSASGIAAARYLDHALPLPRTVALEQAWAYGDRIFLRAGTAIRDFPPARPLDPDQVRRAAQGADAVGLYTVDSSPAVARALAEMRFAEKARFHRDTRKDVVVYLRR